MTDATPARKPRRRHAAALSRIAAGAVTAGRDVGVLRWVAAGSVAVVVLLTVARLLANIPEPPPPAPRSRRTPPAAARAGTAAPDDMAAVQPG